MAVLLHKFVQVLLLLFCICKESQLHSSFSGKLTKISREYQHSLATVAVPSDGEKKECLAVWFTDNCLLTAASCFDELGKRNFTKDPLIDVKITIWRYNVDDDPKSNQGKKDQYWEETRGYNGEAIVHPHYKRKAEKTFAYDLAVVRVEKFYRLLMRIKRIKICSYDYNTEREKYVFAKERYVGKQMWLHSGHSHEYDRRRIYQVEPRYFAVVPNEGVYYINSSIQFTAYTGAKEIGSDFLIGGPVLDVGVGNVKCVAGIVNFVGTKWDKTFITSTKVYPVREWIDFTRQYLKKAKSKRRLDKIYGPEGDAFWKNKINMDPIGPSNVSEQAGKPLSNTELKGVQDKFFYEFRRLRSLNYGASNKLEFFN